MQRLRLLSISSALLSLMALSAFAQTADFNEPSLVVIRFNQPRVYYDQQLYSAVAQAVSAKSSVTFEIVSYAPETGNSSVDAQWQQAASTHAQAVVKSMQNIGVPLSRMQVIGQRMAGLKFDEVHVIPR